LTDVSESHPVPDSLLRRVRLSVLLGTTIEWYDFLLYGATAAVVFGPLFFPTSSPLAATLLSFSTFAVGFAARPIGGLVFGHFGDRIGRKKMLIVSMMLLGVATVLMGALPTHAMIGNVAPVLLVVLRFVQGVGVGGEWGGAVLTAIEYAPRGKRGLFGSLPQVGVPLGLLLSTLAFLGVSQLPQEQFLSWGWRLPFLASAVVVVIAMYIRLGIEETPVFKELQRSGRKERNPIRHAVSTYPRQLLLSMVAVTGSAAYFFAIGTFALSYAQGGAHATRSQVLVGSLLSALVMAVCIPVVGSWAQRIGRPRMVAIGLMGAAIWVFPVFGAINSGSFPLLVGVFLVHGAIFSLNFGALATFVAELFGAEMRFSAASLTYQLGSVLGGGVTPLAATAIVSSTGSIYALAGYVAVLALLGAVCAAVLARPGGAGSRSRQDAGSPTVAPDGDLRATESSASSGNVR